MTRRDAVGIGLAALGCLACVSGGSPGRDAGMPSGTNTQDAGALKCSTIGDYGHASATGVLQTGVAPLDYTSGKARVSLLHKRDVDPQENGCVGWVKLVLTTADGACRLELDYDFDAAASAASSLPLTRATLNVDSSCPGWLDANEAEYAWAGGGSSSLAPLPLVADENKSYACVPVALQPRGIIQLSALGKPQLSVDLEALTVEGAAYSEGVENLRCPTL